MLIQTTAQSWLIFQLTDSTFYLGLEGFCLGLPRVLFSALGGAVVDRADRKVIFVITQSRFLLMALFLRVMNYLGTIRVWHLLTVSALTGLFVSFEQPVCQSICTISSRAPICPTRSPFIKWSLIRIPPVLRAESRKSLTGDMVEGLNLAWNTPLSLTLFTVLGIVTFCTKPYTQFMPVFARDILAVGAPGLGLLLMAPERARSSAVSRSRRFAAFRSRIACYFFLAAGFGLSIVLFAGSRHLFPSLLFLFIVGGFQTTFLSAIATLLQIHTDETNRGRIMSLFGLINRGLGPMGSFPFGLNTTAMTPFMTLSKMTPQAMPSPELHRGVRDVVVGSCMDDDRLAAVSRTESFPAPSEILCTRTS